MLVHNAISVCAMTKGKAYPKTTPRRYIGIANPPSKAMHGHKTISVCAIIMVKAYPKTTPRQYIGIANPPSKAMPLDKALSDISMNKGKA